MESCSAMHFFSPLLAEWIPGADSVDFVTLGGLIKAFCQKVEALQPPFSFSALSAKRKKA